MSMNREGRQTRPEETAASDAGTFTGNRALMLEEPLLFEIGDLGTTGVDVDPGAREVAGRVATIPGVELVNDSFFNEFTLRLPKEARPAVRAMADAGVLGGVSLGRLYPEATGLRNGLVVAVTETVTDEDVEALATALEEVLA